MAFSVVHAVLGLGQWLQSWDMAAFYAVNIDWVHPVLDPVMVLATQLGLGHAQLALLALLYVLGGPAGKRTALLCLLAFVVSGVAAQALKTGIDRARPTGVVEGCRALSDLIFRHSFPSGHTATSFAIAVVVAARHARWALPVFCLAALVGYSRIYVGVHWPSDVVVGSLIGVATGLACLHEERRRRARASVETAAAAEPALAAVAGRPASP